VEAAGHRVHRMTSGAGHDAMIFAAHVPAAMLFIASPGGRSHCPEESVREEDVAAALECGAEFLRALERRHG
jgi:allantoate deiminase